MTVERVGEYLLGQRQLCVPLRGRSADLHVLERVQAAQVSTRGTGPNRFSWPIIAVMPLPLTHLDAQGHPRRSLGPQPHSRQNRWRIIRSLHKSAAQLRHCTHPERYRHRPYYLAERRTAQVTRPITGPAARIRWTPGLLDPLFPVSGLCGRRFAPRYSAFVASVGFAAGGTERDRPAWLERSVAPPLLGYAHRPASCHTQN